MGMVWRPECPEEERHCQKCDSRPPGAARHAAEAGEALAEPDGRADSNSQEERRYKYKR